MATANLQTPAARMEAPELPLESAAPQIDATPLLPEGVPYLLSADDYFRMIDADIIPEARRVGLWEGSLFEKMGKNIPHSIAQVKLTNALLRLLPEGWFAYSESPILVNARTAPLPDAAIVCGEPDTYSTRGSVPEMSEIGLVIEVADNSLEKNLTVSLQTYARAGLPVYWVVNLVERRVEVYTEPFTAETDRAGYSKQETFSRGTEVPLVLDGLEVARVAVDRLLPREPY